MASPLCDPLSCDEQTQDWDTSAGGDVASLPGRGWSPAPRCRDDDSDGENGSASEEEDEAPDDTYWREKMAAQAALAPEADYPDWHPAVGGVDRVRLVDWIGRVRGCVGTRLRARGLRKGWLTRGVLAACRCHSALVCASRRTCWRSLCWTASCRATPWTCVARGARARRDVRRRRAAR